MAETSTAAKDDILTIIAISIVALMLSTMLHEGIGHGLVVHAFEEAEKPGGLFVEPVMRAIENRGDPAHYLPIFSGEKHLHVGIRIERMFFPV